MELAAALRKAGAREGCTLFTTLLAGWRTLLWRLSGNADPVVLVPAAAQAQVQGKVLVAHGVHLLPICEALDPKASAADVMRDLRAVVLDAYEHQTATYGSLIRDLAPAREPGRLPLSEIQFNLERVGRKAGFNGLTAEVFANGKRAVNFDLFLNIVDTGQGLRLECDYSTSLYDESTIARWLDCYRTLLESMISEPNRSIGELALLPRAIQKKLQATNATATGPLPAESVPDLIAQAFRDMPANPAADFYGMEISRAELTERTDRLASWLLRNGAGQGSLVGVYMDRSLEMLVAILGTMKAGAAYVPLDPAFPPARNAQIVEETKVPVMLTLTRHLETLPESKAQALALDEAAATLAAEPIVNLPEIGPEDRAYVIFTSGSTGRPKGVELTHRSVVNLLVDLRQRLSMTPVDRLLAVTTLSFDISVLELLLPLVSGGTVLIAHREDVVDGVRLMELLEASRATALQATPVTWRMLLEQGFKPQPGFKMFCGGEAWTTELADRLLEGSGESGARLWNMYGPTETTVWSSVTEVKSGAKRMTIGPPMANTRFYVLDERLQPVPPGVSGELFIGGWGVARGYFNRPELTTEKFLKDPFIPSERMYRTGDEVRQVPDGRIEFIGRLDGQVKLRGYRIEMGEIETAMRALPGIGEAVAVLRRDTQGEGVLVGYYTGGSGHGQIEFRQMLRAMLPSYMIPAMLLPIERIPLTPNGKVDRRALPVVECVGDRVEDAFVDAVTPTETVLTEIFRQVLGREKISTGASLLDLGVDSLRMFQIASRAKRRGLDVTVRRLMHLHTIQAVAAALDAESEGAVAYKVSSTPLRRVSRENYRRDF
jgi:amino acid adenylation domain-containing protein